jgi:hypothetical protein
MCQTLIECWKTLVLQMVRIEGILLKIRIYLQYRFTVNTTFTTFNKPLHLSSQTQPPESMEPLLEYAEGPL